MTDPRVSDDQRFRHCLEIQRRVSSEHDLDRLAKWVEKGDACPAGVEAEVIAPHLEVPEPLVPKLPPAENYRSG